MSISSNGPMRNPARSRSAQSIVALPPFLLGDPRVREVFLRHHADLLDADYWNQQKDRILAGHVHDVFPYDVQRRFGPP